MKTTKRTILESKIAKLVSEKKLSKNSRIYKWLMQVASGEKNFRPVFSTGGSWAHSSLIDERLPFMATLKSLGIEFEGGNDAPKGGKTGAFVIIKTIVKQ